MGNKKRSSDGRENLLARKIKKLSQILKKYDKSMLISLVTGVVFIILGALQLILVIADPPARTFDRIALVLVDFIIAAVCLVFVFYSVGLTDAFVRKGGTVAENNTQKSGKSEDTDISRIFLHTPSRPSSRPQKKSSASQAENENLFSPRHRYSDSSARHSRTDATRTSAQSGGAKFNSRHTGG